MATTNRTKLLGIIGTPVEHTLSPKMHSFFAEQTGQDVVYLAFDVGQNDFADVVSAAKKMGAQGFNITSPYKIEVMRFLDEIDPEAKRMGTVNTIVNRDGKWIGYNTDGVGFANPLIADFGSLKGKKTLFIGAGGSAASVSYQLAKNGIRSIDFLVRNKKNLPAIRTAIEEISDCVISEGITEKEYDFIINTTPLGMFPHEKENPFSEHMDYISKDTVCCDLIYNPKKSVFLAEAERRGAQIMNGLPMLVMQGIYAFELFTGTKLPASCFEETMALLGEYRLSE